MRDGRLSTLENIWSKSDELTSSAGMEIDAGTIEAVESPVRRPRLHGPSLHSVNP